MMGSWMKIWMMGALLAMVSLGAVGCSSLASRMASADVQERYAARAEYRQLSVREQLEIQRDLAAEFNDATSRAEKERIVECITHPAILGAIAKSSVCGPDEIRGAVQLKAVKQLADVKTLVDVARGAAFANVQCAAIGKITDQAALADLAKRAGKFEPRLEAALLLSDRALKERMLYEIVMSLRDARSGLAIEPITEQGYLVKIALNARLDQTSRLKAVRKVTDQAALIQLVKGDKLYAVREAALRNVTDQAFLAELVRGKYSENLKRVALENITDSDVLGEIAQNKVVFDGDEVYRRHSEQLSQEALNRLPADHRFWQEKVFAEVMAHFEQFQGRDVPFNETHKAVLEKLTNQDYLVEFLFSKQMPSNYEFQRMVMQRLTNQSLLGFVAKDHPATMVRQLAVVKLTDQKMLAEVAKQDVNAQIRATAMKALTDQEALATIALESKYANERQEAVERLQDQAALAKVAQQDEQAGIRLIAVKKLTDEQVLAAVAKRDISEKVSLAAVERITDATCLMEVAMAVSSDAVTQAVKEKLPSKSLRKVTHKVPSTAERLTITAGEIPSGEYFIDEVEHALDTSVRIQSGSVVTIYLCGGAITEGDIIVNMDATLTLKQGTLFVHPSEQSQAQDFCELRNKGTLILEDVQVNTRVVNHGEMTLVDSRVGSAEASLATVLQTALQDDLAARQVYQKYAQKMVNNPLCSMRDLLEELSKNEVTIPYSGVDNYGTCTLSGKCIAETIFNYGMANCTVNQASVGLVYNDRNARMKLNGVKFGGVLNKGQLHLEEASGCLVENSGVLQCQKSELNELQNEQKSSAILVATTLLARTSNLQQKRWTLTDLSIEEPLPTMKKRGNEAFVNNKGTLSIRMGSNLIKSVIENRGQLKLSGVMKADKMRLKAIAGQIYGSEVLNGENVPYMGSRIVVQHAASDTSGIVVTACAPSKFVVRFRDASFYAKEVPSSEDVALVDLKIVQEK